MENSVCYNNSYSGWKQTARVWQQQREIHGLIYLCRDLLNESLRAYSFPSGFFLSSTLSVRESLPLGGQHSHCFFAFCRKKLQEHLQRKHHQENGGISLQIQIIRRMCAFSYVFLCVRTKHVSPLILSLPGTFRLLQFNHPRTLGNNLRHFSWTLTTADNIFRLAWQPNKPCLASRSRTLAICSFPYWYLSHQHLSIGQIQ